MQVDAPQLASLPPKQLVIHCCCAGDLCCHHGPGQLCPNEAIPMGTMHIPDPTNHNLAVPGSGRAKCQACWDSPEREEIG